MYHRRWYWISLLGILSALWAVIELSLGTTLFILHVPLRGAFLTVLALPLMFLTRLLIPRRGSVAALGVSAATVRWLLGGSFAPQISLAIAMEAILVELGLGPVTRQSIPRWRGALGGALGLAYTAAHPVLFWGILMGGGRGIELPIGMSGYAIFGAILGLHMIAGAVAGFWAIMLLGRLPIPIPVPAAEKPERREEREIQE